MLKRELAIHTSVWSLVIVLYIAAAFRPLGVGPGIAVRVAMGLSFWTTNFLAIRETYRLQGLSSIYVFSEGNG